MTFSPQEIDRIVAQVLAQLQPSAAAPVAPGPRTESLPSAREIVAQALADAKPAAPAARPAADELLTFDQAVLTADILRERLTHQKTIRIRPNAVLTPSARDLIKVRQIECVRDGVSAGNSKSRWLAISSKTAAPIAAVIEQLKTGGAGWSHRLSGTTAEATEQGVSVLCTAEADGVVVLTGEPELSACLANRNARIRAAAVETVEALNRLRQSFKPNLLALDPAGKSFFVLRNLFKTFAGT